MTESPTFASKSFRCPHCSVLAQQEWFDATRGADVASRLIRHIYLDYRLGIRDHQQLAIRGFLEEIDNRFLRNFAGFIPDKVAVSTCSQCGEPALWFDKQVVFPKTMDAQPPNQDLEADIVILYHEASSIITDSPRGAAALLRLALQRLLRQLGKSGQNINEDIRELVSDGLSPKIQQALDLVRVIGNHAVHPGEIDLDDNREIAEKLFQILNFIAEEMISKPRELEQLYNETIPESTREHIRRRDGTD